jgi:hemicentin
MMALVPQPRFCIFLFLVVWLPLSHQQSDDVDSVVPYSTHTWPPASLTFVFDITGSMNDDLEQVKQGANAIFKAILSQSVLPVQEFIVVPFHDPG